MSGPAVIIVESGGLPVTPVESGAPVFKVVTSGGIAVTVAPDATPVILDGYTPPG